MFTNKNVLNNLVDHHTYLYNDLLIFNGYCMLTNQLNQSSSMILNPHFTFKPTDFMMDFLFAINAKGTNSSSHGYVAITLMDADVHRNTKKEDYQQFLNSDYIPLSGSSIIIDTYQKELLFYQSINTDNSLDFKKMDIINNSCSMDDLFFDGNLFNLKIVYNTEVSQIIVKLGRDTFETECKFSYSIRPFKLAIISKILSPEDNLSDSFVQIKLHHAKFINLNREFQEYYIDQINKVFHRAHISEIKKENFKPHKSKVIGLLTANPEQLTFTSYLKRIYYSFTSSGYLFNLVFIDTEGKQYSLRTITNNDSLKLMNKIKINQDSIFENIKICYIQNKGINYMQISLDYKKYILGVSDPNSKCEDIYIGTQLLRILSFSKNTNYITGLQLFYLKNAVNLSNYTYSSFNNYVESHASYWDKLISKQPSNTSNGLLFAQHNLIYSSEAKTNTILQKFINELNLTSENIETISSWVQLIEDDLDNILADVTKELMQSDIIDNIYQQLEVAHMDHTIKLVESESLEQSWTKKIETIKADLEYMETVMDNFHNFIKNYKKVRQYYTNKQGYTVLNTRYWVMAIIAVLNLLMIRWRLKEVNNMVN